MNTKKWLRNCKLRRFKKWHNGKYKIFNSGYSYTIEDYDLLINIFENLKIGDMIYNSVKYIKEPIKEIISYWESDFLNRYRILRYEIITESGAILYNIDEEPSEEIKEIEKKIMERFNGNKEYSDLIEDFEKRNKVIKYIG